MSSPEIALFEAAVMYAYTAAVGGSQPDGVVAGFDRPAAAAHFRATAGTALWTVERSCGIRHRHFVVEVRAADRDRVRAALRGAWTDGARLLHRSPAPSSPAARRRAEHAAATWRALLTAATPVRGRGGLRIRLPTVELAATAVRAARLLDVPAQLRRRERLYVVVLDADAAALMRSRCGAATPVDHEVAGRESAPLSPVTS